MKILRGLLSGIIGILIFILIFSLTFSFILKNVIKKDILNGVVKEKVINEYTKEVNSETKEVIENIFGQNEISDIAETIIDEYLKYTKNADYEISSKMINKIIDFCSKNKELISKISKEEITEEKLRSKETYDNIYKTFKDAFPEVKEQIGSNGKTIVEIYSIIVNKNTRLIVFATIIALIILLILIQMSFFKWMKKVGVSLIITGIIFSSLYVVINIFKENILDSLEVDINFNPISIIIIGSTEIIVGILLIILKNILTKDTKNEITY